MSYETQYMDAAEARYQASLEPKNHPCFDCEHYIKADSDNTSERLDSDIIGELGYCDFLSAFVAPDDTSFYWECEQ